MTKESHVHHRNLWHIIITIKSQSQKEKDPKQRRWTRHSWASITYLEHESSKAYEYNPPNCSQPLFETPRPVLGNTTYHHTTNHTSRHNITQGHLSPVRWNMEPPSPKEDRLKPSLPRCSPEHLGVIGMDRMVHVSRVLLTNIACLRTRNLACHQMTCAHHSFPIHHRKTSLPIRTKTSNIHTPFCDCFLGNDIE